MSFMSFMVFHKVLQAGLGNYKRCPRYILDTALTQ